MRSPRTIRASLVAVLVGVPLALLLAAPSEPDPLKIPARDFSNATAFKVSRVIDGDTIVVNIGGKDTRVRLIGVDTPETVHPQKPVERFGKEASRFTTELLQGKSVYLEYDQQRTDRYGRTLAYAFRAPDGLFVNLEIIRLGFGHAYTKYPFRQDYMDLFRAHENAAREGKKGLWGDNAPATAKGDPPGKVEKPPADVKAEVFVTRTGAKYHREGCRHLAKSKIPLSLEEARKKYESCAVCNPPR